MIAAHTRSPLLLALLATCCVAAQATPLVEAQASSMAQAGQQPVSSYAHIRNGVPVAGGNSAGSNGSSAVGGDLSHAWADTTQIDGALLSTTLAQANLATGQLRVYAESGVGASTAFGYARWTDTVTFNNTTGSAVELGLSWRTDGVVTDRGNPLSLTSDVWSSIQVSSVNTNAAPITLKDQNPLTPGFTSGDVFFHHYRVGAYNPGDGFGSSAGASYNAEGIWKTTLFDGVGGGGLVEGTLVVPAGMASLDITVYLDVGCRGGVICDFGHTASFGFGALPTGLSWTSASGVFLSAPVPEPGAWALLALGLVALSGAVRRRGSSALAKR